MKDMEEKTTKEKIFEAALEMFARKGFDAVSMREIADAVGIKKASLYSHFTSKDELLEKLFEYPMSRFSTVAPQGDAEQMILSMGVDGFFRMASGVFTRWMEGPGMEKIWRIVCIEMYHNEPMKMFYEKFMGEAYSFWTSNFAIMIKHGLIKPSDPEVLVEEYLSFYIYTFLDYFIVKYGTAGSFMEAEGKRLDGHEAFLVRSIKA